MGMHADLGRAERLASAEGCRSRSLIARPLASRCHQMTHTFTIAIDGPPAPARARWRGGSPTTTAEPARHRPDLSRRRQGAAPAGLPLDNVSAAETAARQVELAGLDRAVLSAHAVGEAASKVAVIPTVRRILVEKQRDFAKTPPGAVLDGRDIGTVVCPDADVKLYVTASAEVRAQRRLRRDREHRRHGRFRRNPRRHRAPRRARHGPRRQPLKPAADAHLLDTSRNGYRGRVSGGQGDHRRRLGQERQILSSVSLALPIAGSAEDTHIGRRTSLPAFFMRRNCR